MHDHASLLDGGEVVSLNVPCTTTGALMERSYAEIEASVGAGKRRCDANKVTFLSPITTPTKVLCQGANYRQHMLDSGVNPDTKSFNMLFTKSAASITGPTRNIIKQRHVTLLDYEIELTLVLAKQTRGPVQVHAGNLLRWRSLSLRPQGP